MDLHSQLTIYLMNKKIVFRATYVVIIQYDARHFDPKVFCQLQIEYKVRSNDWLQQRRGDIN